MKALSKVLVEVESMYDDKIKYGTLELYVDTSYRPEHHVRQRGVAHDDFSRLGVKKGDILWFHYLSLKEDNRVYKDDDTEIYAIEPEMFYAKGEGESLETLNDHVLVNMVKQEKSSNIVLTVEKEFSETKGIVLMGGELDGEKVLFHESCANINTIDGKQVYVMQKSSIFAVCN